MLEIPFEERYKEVLHYIEGVLIPVYERYLKMTDHGAIYVIETLIWKRSLPA